MTLADKHRWDRRGAGAGARRYTRFCHPQDHRQRNLILSEPVLPLEADSDRAEAFARVALVPDGPHFLHTCYCGVTFCVLPEEYQKVYMRH